MTNWTVTDVMVTDNTDLSPNNWSADIVINNKYVVQVCGDCGEVSIPESHERFHNYETDQNEFFNYFLDRDWSDLWSSLNIDLCLDSIKEI